VVYKISFRNGGDASFYESIKTTVRKKEWSRQTGPGTKPRESLGGSTGQAPAAGLDHLMKQASIVQSESRDSIEDAFLDLKALIAKADEMMALAADLQTKVDKRKAGLGPSQSPVSDDEMIERALSKASASIGGMGSDRSMVDDLSSWIPNYLQEQGGLMTMPEVWCRWNRLRGLNPISPQDALQATKVLSKRADQPVLLKELKSGVIILCDGHFSPSLLGRRIVGILSARQGMTTLEIKTHLGIELQVNFVDECIQECELDPSALICRDDNGLQGVIWYKNIF